MIDSIVIEGIEVTGVVGAHSWERQWQRPLVVDLALGLDISAAAASDQLRDTVDYQAVVDAIGAFAGSERFTLVETFAERLARQLFERFAFVTLDLTVAKPGALAGVRSISVRLQRRREDYAVCGR
jgi:dihydroneopterin aldolase